MESLAPLQHCRAWPAHPGPTLCLALACAGCAVALAPLVAAASSIVTYKSGQQAVRTQLHAWRNLSAPLKGLWPVCGVAVALDTRRDANSAAVLVPIGLAATLISEFIRPPPALLCPTKCRTITIAGAKA